MNFFAQMDECARRNNSLVCVGLDPALSKLPEGLQAAGADGILTFNRAIVDATRDYVCAYKPQAAYYAGQDCDWVLKETIAYIKERAPWVPVILDVKRGDIGSTAEWYAKEAFVRYGADAVTVNPYMGYDAVKPFLDIADKGVYILCRTSNPHSGDLQNLTSDGKPLFVHVADLVREKWNGNANAGLVVGATYPEELRLLRELCPELPFLVPGVGAQGGDIEKVVHFGCRASGDGIAVNSSRGIIYASSGSDYAAAAGKAAAELRDKINSYR